MSGRPNSARHRALAAYGGDEFAVALRALFHTVPVEPEQVQSWLVGSHRVPVTCDDARTTSRTAVHPVGIDSEGVVTLHAHDWQDLDAELTIAALSGVVPGCLAFWYAVTRGRRHPHSPAYVDDALVFAQARAWAFADPDQDAADRAVLLAVRTAFPVAWQSVAAGLRPRDLTAGEVLALLRDSGDA